MMIKTLKYPGIFILIMLCVLPSAAQEHAEDKRSNYLSQSWKKVATQMPDEWYGSTEAKTVAENVIFCQQDIGGWAKNKPYHHPLTRKDSMEVVSLRSGVGSTFDNGATITEMIFLSKMYAHVKDPRYRERFIRGLNYIFQAQYKNGGWPQFYPFRKGKTVSYASHITYNDNAIVNIMTLLNNVANDAVPFVDMKVDNELKTKARSAFDKGIECILSTQIKVKGKPTVWCAQHDEVTLAPANARAYELASFSGSESAGITLLLMELKNPSARIVNAVEGAVHWFETHKIEGVRLELVKESDGRENTVLINDNNAPAIWARFYDLESGKPFFCDRDGVKKYSLAEIGYERRNGYSWYVYEPRKVLTKYPAWSKKYAGK
jgi:pectinesterase